jgi:hypothetical protein
LSVAITLPVTAPVITTAFAEISALMLACEPMVSGQLDASFHLTAQGEVLGATQFALDDHGLAEIHDELLRRCAIDARGLRGLVALTA